MTMEAISDLPMLDDMDADYSPQYLKEQFAELGEDQHLPAEAHEPAQV